MNPKNLAIEPNIAKSWEINDEQTKYTFHLRMMFISTIILVLIHQKVQN